MTDSIKNFVDSVEKANPNETEFIQAVQEVAETVIPFIENTVELGENFKIGVIGRLADTVSSPLL